MVCKHVIVYSVLWFSATATRLHLNFGSSGREKKRLDWHSKDEA